MLYYMQSCELKALWIGAICVRIASLGERVSLSRDSKFIYKQKNKFHAALLPQDMVWSRNCRSESISGRDAMGEMS